MEVLEVKVAEVGARGELRLREVGCRRTKVTREG